MKSNNIIQSFLIINDLPFVINNWYFKAYCKIIKNSLSKNRKKLKKNDPQYVYYESHHIHPRSLGGSDNSSNLVLLTKYEHFLVHWLFTKCISGNKKYKIMKAFNNMCIKSKYHEERYIPKYKFAKIIKQNREGIKHSEETKKKMSEGQKRRYENTTPEEKAITIKNWKESYNNKTPEEKAIDIRTWKESYNNKTPEEKTIEFKNRSKGIKRAIANRTPDQKAIISKNMSEAKRNMTLEEKAKWKSNIRKSQNNRTPEEKNKWRKKQIESQAFKYAKEETDFLLQQKTLGLSIPKITKAFNEQFRELEDYVGVKGIRNHIHRILNII